MAIRQFKTVKIIMAEMSVTRVLWWDSVPDWVCWRGLTHGTIGVLSGVLVGAATSHLAKQGVLLFISYLLRTDRSLLELPSEASVRPMYAIKGSFPVTSRLNRLLLLRVGNRFMTPVPLNLVVAMQQVAGRLIMTLLTRLVLRVSPVLPALPQISGRRAGRTLPATKLRSAAFIRVFSPVLCSLVRSAVPVTGELLSVIIVRPIAQHLLEKLMVPRCPGATETRPTLKLKLPLLGVHDPPNGIAI